MTFVGFGLGDEKWYIVTVIILSVIIVILLALIFLAWRRKLKLINAIQERKKLAKEKRLLTEAGVAKQSSGAHVRGDSQGHMHLLVKSYDTPNATMQRRSGLQTPSNVTLLDTHSADEFESSDDSSVSFSSTEVSSTTTDNESSSLTFERKAEDRNNENDKEKEREEILLPGIHRSAIGSSMPKPVEIYSISRSTSSGRRLARSGDGGSGLSDVTSPPNDFRRSDFHGGRKRRGRALRGQRREEQFKGKEEDAVHSALGQVVDDALSTDVTEGQPEAAAVMRRSREQAREELRHADEDIDTSYF